MTKLVVFDVDGTILDSFGLYAQAVATYSRDNGLPMPCLDTIKIGYGDPHNHDFKWGVDRDEQRRHLIGTFQLAEKWETSGNLAHVPDFFAGALDMLIALKDTGHALAIVTSRPSHSLHSTLYHHGVGKLFSAIRTGCDVKARGEKEKPEPDQLLSVIRELAGHAQKTVMVGDTVMDIKMGLGAQAHTVGVTWGVHPRAHLEKAGAHHIVSTQANDIVSVVKSIFG